MSSSQSTSESSYKKALLIVENLHNIGDLFLLIQAVEGLRQFKGIEKFNVWQWQLPNKEVLDELNKKNINVIYGKSFASLINFRTLIVIAGGQAIRKNKSFASLIFIIATIIFSSIFKCKFIAIGIGVAEIANPTLRKFWRFLLGYFSTIYVRDASSLKRINGLLNNKKRLKLTTDLAFYKSSQYDYIQNNQTQKHIIIAPCHDPSDGRYLSEDAVAEIAIAVSEKLNIRKFVLLAHDVRESMDVLLCENIAKKICAVNHMEVKTIKSLHVKEYLDAYQSAAFIMTNRLHSLIFGVISNKPIVVIEDGSDKLIPLASKFYIPIILQGQKGLASLNDDVFKVDIKRKELLKMESIVSLSNFTFR